MMSHAALGRLQILQRVAERRMTQAAAAQTLGLSYRQVKRLMARFPRQGAAGLQLLRFVEGESTFDYMRATKTYIERYGKPVAFYSDKHTGFHVNKRSGVGGNGMTQYGRALHELGIEILCANTPAAIGSKESKSGALANPPGP